MKVVAMIPVRTGSKRVKNKNLRLINNKHLVEYIIESTIEANEENKIFDEIYINSESDLFKSIADKNNIKFYKRLEELSSDEATNDDFMLDFLQNVECDIVVQLLATSPFITSKEIKDFCSIILKNNYDTLVSITNIQIECIYENKGINFDKLKKTPPSQSLEPVKAYACGIMGWKKEKFIDNMNKFSSAYHGGDGNTGYFELKGLSTIDIDTEDDFLIAKKILGDNSSDFNKLVPDGGCSNCDYGELDHSFCIASKN